MSSRVVGIDIGSVSVRAVELKQANKAKPVIVRFHEVPLPDGSVRRGEVLEIEPVSAAIKNLWSAGGFTAKEVIIGMGGPRVLSRDLTMPLAPLAQIKEALPFHVQDMLPVPVGDTLLDFYPISEEESESGPVIRGLLVAALKEAVSANIAAVTGAGLRPVQVDLIPFAQTRALAPIRTTSGLFAIVSIGANTTNVVIVLNGVPQFVRIIAAGGDDITRGLATRLQLEPVEAERVKREVGLRSNAQPEQQPAVGIIREISGELLTSIRNTLSYYLNTKPGAVLSCIMLSGGGSALPGLQQSLGDMTNIPTEQAEPLGGAQLSRKVAGSFLREKLDAMTTAYGLALGANK